MKQPEMYLPPHVLGCINALEAAGFSAWAVGGCVRDACLGLTPHDYDLCTNALPDQTEAVFADFPLVLNGKKHGTVSVITGGEMVEITTFRTEGDYLDNRHPQWVEFVPNIEEDLARRDFTVNAMAYSPTRGFADPFGGREDLKNHVLRAVGSPYLRFTEDALRVLRGVRFAVRYQLTPEAETENAMAVLAPRVRTLAVERIFDELCKLLPLVTADDLIRFAPVLTEVIPELKPALGFDQRNPHHVFDLYTHIAHVVEHVPPQLPLRWAALLHDIGKISTFTLDENGCGHFYGHAGISAEMADRILMELKAPTALREQVVFLIDKHMTRLEPDKKLLRRRFSQYGIEATYQLLSLQQADLGSKGSGDADRVSWFDMIGGLLDALRKEDACLTLKDLAVNGNDLKALGFEGKAIGACLKGLLDLVLDETVPNEKEPLLTAAKQYPMR